jgi:hypothetical protein
MSLLTTPHQTLLGLIAAASLALPAVAMPPGHADATPMEVAAPAAAASSEPSRRLGVPACNRGAAQGEGLDSDWLSRWEVHGHGWSIRGVHRASDSAAVTEGIQAAHTLAQAAHQEEKQGTVPRGQRGAVHKGDWILSLVASEPGYDPQWNYDQSGRDANGRLYQHSGMIYGPGAGSLAGQPWAVWRYREDTSRTLRSWQCNGVGWTIEGVHNESEDPTERDGKDPQVADALNRLFQAARALQAAQREAR